MKKNVITIFTTLLFTSILFLFLFKPVLQNPNSYLYSKSGDAQKSYFNFAYYLKYDSGIKHDGINYPYGDHLQYINSHPLYVQILKFVDANITPIADYGVGILNLTMIISLILAIPFLFLILRHYALPRWYAAIFSVILLLLTPQFDRIHGHFEMVYAFFLPMYWYLLIRFRSGQKPWLWGSLMVTAGLIGGFTSAYYASFYAIFILGVLFVEIWNNRNNLTTYWKKGLVLLFLAIIPLVVVKGLVSVTDWVSDRPNNPYGFDVYHATFLSIFLPFSSPLKALLGNYVNMDFQWEGRAYVGLPATLLAISIFIFGVINLFSRKKNSWRLFASDNKMQVYLYASILVLLFSMCIPFKYGFNFILDILPPVKQFRALGRFSWIFYYVFTIYAVWFFYRLFLYLKLKKMPVLASVLLVLIIGYWSIDAGTNIKRSTRGLLNTNDKLESSDVEYLSRFEEAGVKADEFQAIFFLPFASTCGDKLLFERGMNAFADAMKCSYHTGLPLIQSFSPRLSFTNALSSIQMLADPAIEKVRLNDMNDKPILLVCTKENMHPEEAWLRSKAEVFWEDKYITLSRLPLNVFHESHQNWKENVQNSMKELIVKDNYKIDSSLPVFVYNNFENENGKIVFSGNGAFYSKKGENELLNIQLDDSYKTGKYELSFWLYVDSRHYDMPKATLNITNAGGENNEKRLNTREVHNVYNHWIRVAEKIDLKPGDKIQLKVKGEFVSIDDLLLKPVSSTIVVEASENFELFNNFPYSKP